MLPTFSAASSSTPRRFGGSAPRGLGLARAGMGPGAGRLLDGGNTGAGRDERKGAREIWTPNDGWRAPSAIRATTTRKGTQSIRMLGGDHGTKIGGRFIAPGAELILEFDPTAGALLDRNGALLLGLTTQDVHDPTELATYLAGYATEEYRHDQIVQVIPVDKDEDKYRTFNSGAAFRPVVVKTDDDMDAAELKVTSSLTNYRVVVRRIGAFIPDPTRNQANANYDVEFVHMERCRRAIDLDLELDIIGPSGLLTTAGNWNSNNVVTLAAGYQWGGASGVGANSDPVADIRARMDASAQRITGWWMNQRVAGLLLDNPKFRDYTRANMGDAPLDAAVRAVSDADNGVVDFKIRGLGVFHVVASRVESNAAGTTTDYVMPDVFLGVTQPPGVPTNGGRIATAYNFRRKGPAGVGFYTRTVAIPQRGAGGTLLIVEEASIPTMTSGICGGLVLGVSQ